MLTQPLLSGSHTSYTYQPLTPEEAAELESLRNEATRCQTITKVARCVLWPFSIGGAVLLAALTTIYNCRPLECFTRNEDREPSGPDLKKKRYSECSASSCLFEPALPPHTNCDRVKRALDCCFCFAKDKLSDYLLTDQRRRFKTLSHIQAKLDGSNAPTPPDSPKTVHIYYPPIETK